MSERYNVAASAVLGENYKITNIEASDYNPSKGDTRTITVTITDVYGDPISSETVNITASDNYTDTGTTDSSGQCTFNYTCNTIGLTTFTCNNKSQQVQVQDIWTILVNEENYYCRTKDNRVQFFVNLSTAQNFTDTWTQFGTTSRVPTGYRPSYSITSSVSCAANVNTRVMVKTDGTVHRISLTGSTISSTGYFFFEWSI